MSCTLYNRRSSGGFVVEVAPTLAEAPFEQMPVGRMQRGSGRRDHDPFQLEPFEVGQVVGQDLVNALLACALGVEGVVDCATPEAERRDVPENRTIVVPVRGGRPRGDRGLRPRSAGAPRRVRCASRRGARSTSRSTPRACASSSSPSARPPCTDETRGKRHRGCQAGPPAPLRARTCRTACAFSRRRGRRGRGAHCARRGQTRQCPASRAPRRGAQEFPACERESVRRPPCAG